MKKLLIIHNDVERLEELIREFEAREWEVSALGTLNLTVNQLQVGKFSLLLVHEDGKALVKELVGEMKSNPLTAVIPIVGFVNEQNMRAALTGDLLGAIDDVAPDAGTAVEAVDMVEAVYGRIRKETHDDVTGLLTGSSLNRCLSAMCDRRSQSWYFLALKLLDLKPFNLHYGYDRGDELMKAVGETVLQEVTENGEVNDLVARGGGDMYYVITQSPRVEAMCRKIRQKSERCIRRYYTPFELMKGIITIENKNGKTDDYDICEIKVAALSVPVGWNENMNYLVDMAKDLLSVLANSDKGYIIYRV